MKSLLIIFLLIAITFLFFQPALVFAQTQEEILKELTEKLINISLAISQLKDQIREFINSFYPLHSQTLGDYLRELFESYNIILNQDDFLQDVTDPYLTFAKILNLIPDTYQSNKKITQWETKKIAEKFLSIKENINYDRLFGKIDMHEHYRTGGSITDFFQAAANLGISKTVFLPTGWGPDNKDYKIHQSFLIKYLKKLYPEKIIAFCTIDEQDPQAAEIFKECLQDGGEGLKLLGGHPNFYDEPLNSENMYRVYQVAEKYKVPVLIHASIINIPELKEQLDQVYSDFPEITFIHAHYCSSIMNGINLNLCAEFLDKHPNLYIDLSMGGGIKRYHKYLTQDLETIKDFVIKYQDRILFGSDIILDNSAYKTSNWLFQRISCDIDLHQKEEYTCQFGEKDWLHQGFNLDREVLKKLYYENPKKLLGF